MKPIGICIVAASLVLAGTANADAPLDAQIARAQAEGLPAAALRNKVSEGRAKNVPPSRIAQVVGRLAEHLRAERQWLRATVVNKQRSRAIPPELWVVVAEARMAGVDRRPLQKIVARDRTVRSVARRIDVLVDLHLRGYKSSQCARLVGRVGARDLGALGRTAEKLRRATGLTHVEVIDQLSRAVAEQGNLRGAERRVLSTAGQGHQHRHGGSGQTPARTRRGGRR